MEQVILNNNVIIQLLLEEEGEEELIYNSNSSTRKTISEIFKTRESEGFYEILIKGHLKENKSKFRDFFSIKFRPVYFYFVIN